MRLKAMQELKWKEVPIVVAEGLTDAQKDEFVIKDNVGFGDWNWEQLANEWDAEELTKWGLDIPGFDFSDANEEIDIDSLDTEMVIKLKYTEEEYQLVKEQLSKIASTPEQAVWKLLGNE
jgi:ParB-like chromosome segregation protein Spo0J